MADYTRTKGPAGRPDPENAIDSSFSRYGPLITAQEVKDRFLYGIRLKSPETGAELTNDIIEEHILDAVAEVEEMTHCSIFPTQLEERHPFDVNLWRSFGYTRLRHRPVASVEDLSVVTSNDIRIWTISLDWLDKGYMARGLLQLLPINLAQAPQQSGTNGGPSGAGIFLSLLGSQAWVGAFFTITYTVGFRNGEFPRQINSLIGCVTAINILIQLAAANARNSSKSLGIDGLSQSSSNQGPAVYDQAIAALTLRRDMLVRKTRNTYGTNMFSSEF